MIINLSHGSISFPNSGISIEKSIDDDIWFYGKGKKVKLIISKKKDGKLFDHFNTAFNGIKEIEKERLSQNIVYPNNLKPLSKGDTLITWYFDSAMLEEADILKIKLKKTNTFVVSLHNPKRKKTKVSKNAKLRKIQKAYAKKERDAQRVRIRTSGSSYGTCWIPITKLYTSLLEHAEKKSYTK